jgi:hypothetical protein
MEAHEIFFNDSGPEAANICSLELLLSGEITSKEGLLIGFLGKESFDRLFLNYSKASKETNLFKLKKERRLNFESLDISNLSLEALDTLLLNEFLTVESEDSLLINILKLDGRYPDLLWHIRIEFLSEDGASLLSEYFEILTESVWESAVEAITNLPPPSSFDSRII